MKQTLSIIIFIFLSFNCLSQLNASFVENVKSISREENVDQTIYLYVDVRGLNAAPMSNVVTLDVDEPLSTFEKSNYIFNQQKVTIGEGVNGIEFKIGIKRGRINKGEEKLVVLKLTYDNDDGNGHTKNITVPGYIKISSKNISDQAKSENKFPRSEEDQSNYVKGDFVQYTDITGFKNDAPNGLLQFQGLIKLPLNPNRTVFASGLKTQWFRSIIFDGLLNRIDKSKNEVDYKYTTYLLSDEVVKLAKQPYLSTTDIWRYSNFQAGVRLTIFGIEKKNLRVQLQSGFKLIQNRPYSEDTVKSGIDSGKVKTDFRPVYSGVRFVELFFKTLKPDGNFDININVGVMWLKLWDSYYQQIEIHQQDPFQRTTALSTLNGLTRNNPMLYCTFRLGYFLDEKKSIGTFLRLNYMRQSGQYLLPTGDIVEGKPISFQERTFYNNFWQAHMGLTFSLEKLFSPGSDKQKKTDGPISNSL